MKVDCFISQLSCRTVTCFSTIRTAKKSKLVYPHRISPVTFSRAFGAFNKSTASNVNRLTNRRIRPSNCQPLKQQQPHQRSDSSTMTDHNLVNLLKPLNVLVYIDNENDGGEPLTGQYCDHLFDAIQNVLTHFLSQKFTIYSTTLDELNRRAWFNTTKLLVIVKNRQIDDSSYLDERRNDILKEFQTRTNNVIVLDRVLLCSSTDLQKFVLNTDLLKSKVQQRLGNEIVYDNFKIPDLTTHYVYSSDINVSSKLLTYLKKEHAVKAELCTTPDSGLDLKFNVKRYLEHLNPANQLGRNLIVSDVTKSTQPIAESSPIIDSLIVITNQQTAGKG